MARAARQVEYAILRYADPGAKPRKIGIILFDRGCLYLRTLEDWSEFSQAAQDAVSELAADLQIKAAVLSPSDLMERLATNFAGNLSISDSQSIKTDDSEAAVRHLFNLHVSSPRATE